MSIFDYRTKNHDVFGNFLFPRKLAVEANAQNMSKLNSQNEAKQYKKDMEKENAKQIAQKLEKKQK